MSKRLRPFLGIDGEGGGANRHRQQNYLLLGAGAGIEPLYTGHHLATIDCLEWLCDLPADPLLVGFSFGYDVTMILRDLEPKRLARLFADKPMGAGYSRYTYFGDYGIEYLPKNYLRVCRLRRRMARAPDGRTVEHITRVPDSARTIYETFGFFQRSFLQALQNFNIGREHWALIERNKAARSGFTAVTDEIIEYNRLECELLAELMETFRETCHTVGIRPTQWSGAGKLAAAEHKSHATITAAEIAETVPPDVMQLAADAYYGGRFEVTRTGAIEGPIWEYDIGSAYPAAMLTLPCLTHGMWRPFQGRPPSRALHVAYVAFDHPTATPLCGLPVRKQDGRLFWPRQGQGVYWSTELTAARKLGATIRYTAGWQYQRNCRCKPFAWIRQRYEQRRALGKDAAGYPIKLGLNSLYGKLAQKIGNPRWGNLVWAGLITAATRAKLMDAASAAPDAVLMFATDGMFTTKQLTGLDLGSGLGQWEAEQHKRLFIVQPGIYWGAKRPKTRGIPASLFANETENFERTWRLWCRTLAHIGAAPPEYGFPVPLFTGLRLAYARGKPETAGRWTEEPRKWSFDWSRKRDAQPIWETPLCVRHQPAAGAPDLVSVPHKANPASFLLDLERLELDDQPDYLDLTPPG